MRLRSISEAVLADLAELRLSGPRAHLALIAALSVGLAVLAALWLRLDSPWWAGISAFVCTQASQPASFTKAAERIAGTTFGAAMAFLMSPWLGEFPFLIPPALLLCSMAAIVGGSVSRYSYTWLLGGITADMVVMGTLVNPMLAPSIAVARTVEITLGAAAALVVASFLAEPGTAIERPAAPGWSGLFGPKRHVLDHALRTGLAVMLVPLVWDWFELPGLDQMAISVAAVMAVPGLADKPEQADVWVRQRAQHRIAGCALGGVAGLAVLAVGLTALLSCLAALMIGVWVGAHLQATTRNTSYVGQQAAVAFILTLVQGTGPPLSLAPGLERLVGMLLGVALLLILSAAWPADRGAALAGRARA